MGTRVDYHLQIKLVSGLRKNDEKFTVKSGVLFSNMDEWPGAPVKVLLSLFYNIRKKWR
jgi:hypothetical protein